MCENSSKVLVIESADVSVSISPPSSSRCRICFNVLPGLKTLNFKTCPVPPFVRLSFQQYIFFILPCKCYLCWCYKVICSDCISHLLTSVRSPVYFYLQCRSVVPKMWNQKGNARRHCCSTTLQVLPCQHADNWVNWALSRIAYATAWPDLLHNNSQLIFGHHPTTSSHETLD